MLLFAEGDVTRLRRELKLVLSRERAPALCERLSVALGGARPPPTRIVSVYFDRPGLPLTARALRTPDDCLKVRTKEYVPDLGAAGRARLVLEVKRERHGVTRKRRAWLTRAELGQALRAGGPPLLALIADGRLQPVLAVTYRRHVYQASQAWRVTVDDDIAFHAVPPGLALSPDTLGLERLGAPCFRDGRVVMEVKHLGQQPPAWIAGLGHGAQRGYSKFAVGMAHVHAGRPGAAGGG